MFTSEEELHINLRGFLAERLGNSDYVVESELKGLFGIPDIVVAECFEESVGHVIALELKLSCWQRALKQAFRYRSFAWECYVVLDTPRSNAALANIEQFKLFNIGLATYGKDGEFKIHYRPKLKQPYSPKIFGKMCSMFSSSSTNDAINVRPRRSGGLGKAFQNLGKAVPLVATA